MANVEELGKKVTLTLGALAAAGLLIYKGTTAYNELRAEIDILKIELVTLESNHTVENEKIWSEFTLLEQRMEKRYKRTTDKAEFTDNQLRKQDHEIIDLEKAMLLLNEHINCVHGE